MICWNLNPSKNFTKVSSVHFDLTVNSESSVLSRNCGSGANKFVVTGGVEGATAADDLVSLRRLGDEGAVDKSISLERLEGEAGCMSLLVDGWVSMGFRCIKSNFCSLSTYIAKYPSVAALLAPNMLLLITTISCGIWACSLAFVK